MPGPLIITVNEKKYEVKAAPDTPLLYVLRNELNLNGPRLECGLEQCGACTVLLGAHAIRSCKTPVAEATQCPITTLEGLGSAEELHPIQQAFLDEQAAESTMLKAASSARWSREIHVNFRSRRLRSQMSWQALEGG